MKKFEKLGLEKHLVSAIRKLGFDEPMKIQKLSIPLLMKGRDVIGQSATGSGKTLAFGSAVVEKASLSNGIQGLILTPTRELAEQVKGDIEMLSIYKKLKVISIYGGVSIRPQIRKLREAEVVVATPGRLLDHIGRKTIDLSNVRVLVLDEADRMLDMGFIKDVEKIIRKCPKKRQTLFFSATISGKIRNLANKYMNNPEEVWAEKQVDPEKLKQVYYDVPKNLKLSLLVKLLKKEDSGLVMVFCNTRRTTDFVVKNLKNQNIGAVAIHGGFSQNKRSNSLNSFNNSANKKVEVLVCTDVAARGWDIDNVSHVYNYDIPNDPNDYVHRIGRTARAGEEGMVINLLSSDDYDSFRKIDKRYYKFDILKKKKPYVKRIKIVTSKRNRGRRGGRRGRKKGKRRRNNKHKRRR